MNAIQSPPMADRRMRRIQKVSKILRAILLAALILEGAILITAAIQLVLLHHIGALTIYHYERMEHFKDGYSSDSDTLTYTPPISDCGGCIVLAFAFMVTLNFFRLFSRLKDGHLFEGQAIEYLEKAARWWIAGGIAQIICQSVHAYFSPNNVNITGCGIFGGLVVFFIAWVLREGQKLKEEQELTV
jgi:hypothetical protein